MLIKKIIIGGILLIGSIAGIKAYAHSQLTEEQKVEKITEKMAKKLKLTEEQKTKVYQINLERSQGHQKAYEAGRKKAILVEAVKKWEDDLRAVLNEEQQKKLRI